MEPIDDARSERRRVQWQKQIDMGKETKEYQAYIKAVPKKRRGRDDPRTPRLDVNTRSKRSFYGLVRKWRIALHAWYKEHFPEDDEDEDLFIPYQFADKCICKGSIVQLCSNCGRGICRDNGCRARHVCQ
jgi:hypothetical protein